MSKQNIAVLTLTVTAVGAIAAHRFIHAAGDQAVAGENALGVSRTSAASGENFPVDVLGTTLVQAGAEISKGDSLKADADGKAITWATSGAKVAIALEAATAADQIIEVLLIQNVA